MKGLFTLLFFFIGITLYAQRGYSDLETIYSDGDVTVQIQYKMSQSSCDNGKPNKFRYKISGYHRTKQYLNWKMDYIACNGNLHFRQYSVDIKSSRATDIVESIDNIFVAKMLERAFYDAIPSSVPSTGSGLIANAYSTDPDYISGNTIIHRGQSATLQVIGGNLGAGGKWVWYKDFCGGSQIGIGQEIDVQPLVTTKYLVRGEGVNNNTNCVWVEVDVNQNSLPAKRIDGPSKICEGETITLSVDGGALGINADWIWYSGSCGGSRIGIGQSIIVAPLHPTTYFVRAEGQANTTICARVRELFLVQLPIHLGRYVLRPMNFAKENW